MDTRRIRREAERLISDCELRYQGTLVQQGRFQPPSRNLLHQRKSKPDTSGQ